MTKKELVAHEGMLWFVDSEHNIVGSRYYVKHDDGSFINTLPLTRASIKHDKLHATMLSAALEAVDELEIEIADKQRQLEYARGVLRITAESGV
jgi:hypothetical protein